MGMIEIKTDKIHFRMNEKWFKRGFKGASNWMKLYPLIFEKIMPLSDSSESSGGS